MCTIQQIKLSATKMSFSSEQAFRRQELTLCQWQTGFICQGTMGYCAAVPYCATRTKATFAGHLFYQNPQWWLPECTSEIGNHLWEAARETTRIGNKKQNTRAMIKTWYLAPTSGIISGYKNDEQQKKLCTAWCDSKYPQTSTNIFDILYMIMNINRYTVIHARVYIYTYIYICVYHICVNTYAFMHIISYHHLPYMILTYTHRY